MKTFTNQNNIFKFFRDLPQLSITSRESIFNTMRCQLMFRIKLQRGSSRRIQLGPVSLMPYVRCIQHFKLQNTLHQRMLKASIVNFLQYLLQCNSIFRIALQQYCKNKNNILITFPRNLSLLPHYLCSLLSLHSLFLICSLLSLDPNIILLPTSTSHITVEETLIQVDQRWRKR